MRNKECSGARDTYLIINLFGFWVKWNCCGDGSGTGTETNSDLASGCWGEMLSKLGSAANMIVSDIQQNLANAKANNGCWVWLVWQKRAKAKDSWLVALNMFIHVHTFSIFHSFADMRMESQRLSATRAEKNIRTNNNLLQPTEYQRVCHTKGQRWAWTSTWDPAEN